MASTSFDVEKGEFRDFYQANRDVLQNARDSFLSLVGSLLHLDATISVSKIEGRVKDPEECISKFTRKYRTALESTGVAYSIRDHITDLIGIRVVCLYEDDIEKIGSIIRSHFDVVDITDKIAEIENTEGSFGYKGLHLDLLLNDERRAMAEYINYGEFRFELQIRTVVQDSWSILDHKIKYKKSIPIGLKRRINTLAALFELSDREFREIRDLTAAEIESNIESYEEISKETEEAVEHNDATTPRTSQLNAFSFLRIARHFYPTFDFEAHKVDGFTKEIVDLEPSISRGKFNFYLRENIGKVKRYQAEFEKLTGDSLNPYTVIRHCLYAGDFAKFSSVLTNDAREAFDKWLAKNPAK